MSKPGQKDPDVLYESEIDEIVGLVNARQPLSYDRARPVLLQALDAVSWCRWARSLFKVPDDVSDGELRQWIGECLANGDTSVIRGIDDPAP